jgi:stearoyl-CoA desaturase (delta-9 desaturase)
METKAPMTRLKRYSTIAALVIPFVALVVAIYLLWNQAVDWFDLMLFAVFYAISVGGVTVGYHRMLTHRAFLSPKPVEYLFALAGSVAVEGPVIQWVADHRMHHAHTDEEGDPHSPHVGHGSKLGGLWHAHAGWFFRDLHANETRYARDLVEDRGMRLLDKYFIVITGIGIVLPGVLGWAYHGDFEGFLRGVLWGGLVRLFFVHHVTFAINSVCHFYGTRRFDSEDRSTNVFWLSVPSFGESWHHNHHAFPRSARHGLRWWEVDPTYWGIRLMSLFGLAYAIKAPKIRTTPAPTSRTVKVSLVPEARSDDEPELAVVAR